MPSLSIKLVQREITDGTATTISHFDNKVVLKSDLRSFTFVGGSGQNLFETSAENSLNADVALFVLVRSAEEEDEAKVFLTTDSLSVGFNLFFSGFVCRPRANDAALACIVT